MTGTSGVRALIIDSCGVSMATAGKRSTHSKVVREARSELGEKICGARSDDDEVGPSPQLDMQDGISNLLPVLSLSKAQG